MKKRRVIHAGNLPATLPINRTVILLIALDYWQANDLCYYLVVAYLILYWHLALYAWVTQVQTDISDKIFWEIPPNQDTAD